MSTDTQLPPSQYFRALFWKEPPVYTFNLALSHVVPLYRMRVAKYADPEGLTEDEGESEGEMELDGDIDAEGDRDGLTDALGEILGDSDGLFDGD